jgi:hypothetical protein
MAELMVELQMAEPGKVIYTRAQLTATLTLLPIVNALALFKIDLHMLTLLQVHTLFVV